MSKRKEHVLVQPTLNAAHAIEYSVHRVLPRMLPDIEKVFPGIPLDEVRPARRVTLLLSARPMIVQSLSRPPSVDKGCGCPRGRTGLKQKFNGTLKNPIPFFEKLLSKLGLT